MKEDIISGWVVVNSKRESCAPMQVRCVGSGEFGLLVEDAEGNTFNVWPSEFFESEDAARA